MIAEFTAYGVAQPQGNKTAFVRNGRAIITEGRRPEAREAFAGWRASVATAARDWQQAQGGVAVLDGPLDVEVTFYLPRPVSTPKRVVYPTKRPDLDKLTRVIGDSLTGIIIADDSVIVSLLAKKRFAIDGPPRAEIRVSQIESVFDAAVARAVRCIR